jgi:pimeloyl-ACP methyl ester carboxylesterase
MKPFFEPIVGRYLNLELLGKPHRLYFEEAGQGVPLLCLHTAGADARQYRGVLNDPEILRHHRVVTFDLPWHGRSSPPAGWHNEEYKLTSRDYMDIILAISDALELDRPIAMGCSIGGRVALHLALHHPERFRSIIGLQSGAHVARYFDSSYLHRSDVHGGEACAGSVSGLISPCSPDNERWETLWHYMQGGPGVFLGDLHFYQLEGDIRAHVAKIDTRRCPLYLLTGEYDYSCSPDDTREVARQAAGIEVTIMERLGHFPMSENPALFLSYLRPVLERIRAATA